MSNFWGAYQNTGIFYFFFNDRFICAIIQLTDKLGFVEDMHLMKKLSKENFEKARDYIFTHGDDITIAWFKYNFENSCTDEFMSVLAQYQHENGGFGGLMY